MGDLRIIAGRWRSRRLKAPAGAAVRPTAERVREAWMSVLGAELEGARVADLFAGSGALGLEALSRGARHVTFVEQGSRALRCLRANIAALDAAELVTVVTSDVFRYLEGMETDSFDIALADPPYGKGLAARLVRDYRRKPFARLLSVEYGAGDALDLPRLASQRSYGDTLVAFILASDFREERA